METLDGTEWIARSHNTCQSAGGPEDWFMTPGGVLVESHCGRPGGRSAEVLVHVQKLLAFDVHGTDRLQKLHFDHSVGRILDGKGTRSFGTVIPLIKPSYRDEE